MRKNLQIPQSIKAGNPFQPQDHLMRVLLKN